jgi:hypothetical protein
VRSDPFKRRQIVERRLRDRALGHLELIEVLGHRKPGQSATAGLIGLIAGGDLSVNERPEQFVGGSSPQSMTRCSPGNRLPGPIDTALVTVRDLGFCDRSSEVT